ncbi:MAG: T9SS type A sorting domain-containing protein, partial [Haliscomenobacter sp.]
DVRANFVAIKIGDVNGNAVASSQVRTAGTFGLNVAEQALKAGNEYSIAFSVDLSQVDGYQFTLGLDLNAVELVNVEAGVAKEENFGIFAKEGVITASWNGDANSSNLFTLVVRAKADANLSEVISLNSRYTAAEAYNKGGEQLNVALNFTGSQPVAAGFDLKQNTPNPFAGETVVGFTLPVAGDATLTVQDVTGRTLRVVKGTYAQGYNQVTLKANELKATGVLYYTLESGEFTATRKMVIIE